MKRCPICQSELTSDKYAPNSNEFVLYCEERIMMNGSFHYNEVISRLYNRTICERIYIDQYLIFQEYEGNKTIICIETPSKSKFRNYREAGRFPLISTKKLLNINIGNILTLS